MPSSILKRRKRPASTAGRATRSPKRSPARRASPQRTTRPTCSCRRTGFSARSSMPSDGRRPAAEKPVDPPSAAVRNQIEELIKTTDVKDMTVEWMRSLYKTHPESAKLVGQVMASPGYADKNRSEERRVGKE